MQSFKWINATSVDEVKEIFAQHGDKARIFAGGSDLMTMLKERLDMPELIVNIGNIKALKYIREEKEGVRIGAMTVLADIAEHPALGRKFTALAQAAEAVGSPQLRNMGSIGGNLCQRPRCWYFRGPFFCIRKGGDTCYAVNGENRYYHAILEGSDCFMVHPSDTAVALIALDADIIIAGVKKDRAVKAENFFIGPSEDIKKENILEPDEFITEIRIPSTEINTRSTFLKTRIRGAWNFALTSTAVRSKSKNGVCQDARVALGGVAPLPLRVKKAERALISKKITSDILQQAADLATSGAQPLTMNRYKVDLTGALVKQAVLATV
jgi:xanthine dehydrogenase YagS FAD-binding subunit